MTAVDVRDSSSIRTRSLSTASSLSSSRMRRPLRPPTRPVATTGTPSRLRARATMTPLPPASVSFSLARWRCPRWKFGTVRIRSSAVFIVTVTIKPRPPVPLAEPAADVVERPLRVPAYAPEGARAATARSATSGARVDDLAAVVDAHLAELLAGLDRQRDHHRRHDPLRQRTAEACDVDDLLRRHEPELGACPRARSRSRNTRPVETTATTRYCASPQARSCARSSLRTERLGSPSSVA